MKEAKLTADQIHALEPFERNFHQATEAAWCSYPGQTGINLMLDIWISLTGSPYPYSPGCPNCLLNLVRDLGVLYFAQKDKVLAEEAAEKVEVSEEPEDAAVKVSKTAENEVKAHKEGNTSKGKRGPKKGKK